MTRERQDCSRREVAGQVGGGVQMRSRRMGGLSRGPQSYSPVNSQVLAETSP